VTNDRSRTAVSLGVLCVLVVLALLGAGEGSLCVGHRTHCAPVEDASREWLFGALVAVALVALVVRRRTV
jgi:MYXO-CTERM domain-containing protein